MRENEFKPNEAFCKENVQQIVVPEIVKTDLLNIIEERLKRAGFYYRIAYRVKAVDSMVDKLLFKDYRRPGTENEDRKMQDLIGLRIMLYFEDDVDTCRSLLDTLFMEPGSWDTTENNEYEFKAMKINGIFRLPGYLSKTIVNPALSDYVDDTFEVQVRTNSFEGWHEIEHDLRYKGSAFGIGNEGLARKMNSILATLELCDDSIVKLLEDLGHQHYKDKKWADMIRCHYRLRMTNDPLLEEVKRVFDEDNELAKKFYKFDRAKVIQYCWNHNDRTNLLTVNSIVRAVNELGPNDERLKKIFESSDYQQDVKEQKRKKFEPFRELGTYKVFQAHTYLDIADKVPEDAFRKAAGYIFAWVRSRFCEVFRDIPETLCSYYNEKPGFAVDVKCDLNKYLYFERTTHPDNKIASRLWISTARLEMNEKGILFTVSNEFAEPADRYRDNENVLFSRPNFYGEIADNIGICDVERLREEVGHIDDKNYENLLSLIENGKRRFPVVVFIAKDSNWVNKFDIDYFAYLVGYYAHIKYIDAECAKDFAQRYHLDMDRFEDSITVFMPGNPPRTNYKSEIVEATYEVIKLQDKKYWNENGCRAYRRQLVSEIRDFNVVEKNQKK